MKRLIAVSFILMTALLCRTQDEPPFTHLVRTSKGMVSMAFHVGNDPECDGLGVAVGYQEYDHPAIPTDFAGEIFLPESIVVSDGRDIPMRWIGRGAFQRCAGITEVHLPPTTYCISDLSFQDCTSLRQMVIPDSMRVIYPRAFLGCTALRRIVFTGSAPPTSYNNDTFDDQTYQTATIVVPAQYADAYMDNPLCYRFRYHAETIPVYQGNKLTN